MKNSYIVSGSGIALIAAAGTIIGFQYLGNQNLRSEVEELRTTLNITAPSLPTDGLPERNSSTKKSDPSEADTKLTSSMTSLRGILALRSPMERMQALLTFVENLPVDQIGKALLELRAGSPDWDPEAKFVAHMLLTRWGQEDPEAAFASAEELGVKRGSGDATSILASLAAVDPARAVAWLNDPDNSLRHTPKMGHILAGTIAKEWVRQDPAAALEWANSLPDDLRRGALGGVLESLASTDPMQAAALVKNLDNAEERSDLVGKIAESWGRQTPSAALEWAQSLEGKEQQRAIEEVLDGWAQTSPAEAASYIDQLPDDGKTDRQITQVAREWGRRDPAQAAAWLGAQPEGDGKRESIGEVIWNWTTTDPTAASTWLSQQPDSPSYDAGAGALAKATFESDPAAAITWAASIGNEQQRTEMINGGLQWWNGRDPEGAQTWAKENGVSLPQPEQGRDEK